MKKNNDSEAFLQKIFERAENPIEQLERIDSIVPIFFASKKNVASANKKLARYGYKINDDYVSEMRQLFAHPSCGPSGGYGSGYGSGHPSCGPSGGYGSGYGSGHPSCGPSGGYGSGYGSGHPSCCSSKNNRGKSLLLIRKNNSGKYNEIRN